MGIIGVNQKITATEMKTYEGMFATPIPFAVLTDIAVLVDRKLPANVDVPTVVAAPTSSIARVLLTLATPSRSSSHGSRPKDS